MWELKLFGEYAEHSFFLEVILPAMEEAGTSRRLDQGKKYNMWGHFDIHAISVARGRHWEPFVQAGQLDLSYRPGSEQWAEGLTFGAKTERHSFNAIAWLTPFEFEEKRIVLKKRSHSRQRRRRKKTVPHSVAPNLEDLLRALLVRISDLLPGKYTTMDDMWAMLNQNESNALKQVLALAAENPTQSHRLTSIPKDWMSPWVGIQRLSSLPDELVPYFELASILHIGNQTHFGYGTFALTTSSESD